MMSTHTRDSHRRRHTPVVMHYVSVSSFPGVRANSIQTARVCEGMVEAGAQVTLWIAGGRSASRTSADEFAHWYGLTSTPRLRRVPAVLSRTPRTMGAVSALLIRLGFRATAVMCRTPLIGVVLRCAGLRAIVEVHSLSDTHALSWRVLQRWPWRRRIVVVAINRELQERLRELAHPSVPLLLEPDCVQASTLQAVEPLPPPSARPKVGYAGRVAPGRGMGLLAELAGLAPWADFLIAGPLEPGFREAFLNGMNDRFNVTWVGELPPSQVRGFLSEMDYLVAPYEPSTASHDNEDTSRWMSPLKVFEYLASGRPMLVSDLPSVREVLSEREAALLPPTDANAWADALSRLNTDPEAARRSVEAALELAGHYTWRERARRVMEQL